MDLLSRFGARAITLGIILLLTPAMLAAGEAPEHPLLGLLQDELKLSIDKLVSPEGTKPYFIQYTITDDKTFGVSATLGALVQDRDEHLRMLDVDVRCGTHEQDSTRQIRGANFSGFEPRSSWARLPLNDDRVATQHATWLRTDEGFKAAVKRLAQVQANLKVKVEEEDPSDDFSRETPSVHVGPWLDAPLVDRLKLTELVKRCSRRFRDHPEIYNSNVTLNGETLNRLEVTSEGSKLQFGRGWWRAGIQASTIADDGMELWQYTAFDAHTPEGLPTEDELNAAVDQVIQDVLALRAAPIVDPYTGPAILMNRASGVFFHEIFGHRIEGHRQKDVEEGQTFAKKLGQEVLPTFLSVTDDPSQRLFGAVELNGYYQFDEECVPAQAVKLVESGVLKTFLMSRSPTRGVNRSNGHGRREPGRQVVARQGNLFVESARKVPFAELRAMLIAECKKQGKEFGLLFKDISGGFTTTRTGGPQAFKVLPILVYRVYADGRPDQLVRGVDIVGTPLTCFSKITATADDAAVFNGVCGAESGGVPVSAISPSILVEQIEIERKQKAQDRPPILPAPIAKSP